MSIIRTQVYLTRDQRKKLDARGDREGKTLAHLIREAVDRYLEEEPADARVALKATFGTLPDLEVPPRQEWDRGYG
jgi:predicted DNA-binding protein